MAHPPAGWYPDPSGAPGLRYWDGIAWTQWTHAAGPESAPQTLGEQERCDRAASKRTVARPLRAKCGRGATFVELVPPGQLPHDFQTWPEDRRLAYTKRFGISGKWHFIFQGIEGGNGLGDDIDAEQAARIAQAFAEPYTFAKVHSAGLFDDAGFCEKCDVPYCYSHWHDDNVGQFRCPRGHWKSLDPHWSPD